MKDFGNLEVGDKFICGFHMEECLDGKRDSISLYVKTGDNKANLIRNNGEFEFDDDVSVCPLREN